MEPNTASSLKSTEKNSIKDFVSIAGPLHVTHLVMFSRSELSPFLRICRLPHGPTLTFKILEYSLSKDIVSIQKRQNTYDKQYLTHPLVVLNNFAGEELKLKLMTSMFQNMFPSINVAKVCFFWSLIKYDFLISFDVLLCRWNWTRFVAAFSYIIILKMVVWNFVIIQSRLCLLVFQKLLKS